MIRKPTEEDIFNLSQSSLDYSDGKLSFQGRFSISIHNPLSIYFWFPRNKKFFFSIKPAGFTNVTISPG